MERKDLYNVLDALKVSISDVEAYVKQRLNTPEPTPVTLVYHRDGKFIYENQYNPQLKEHFIGFFIDNTVFYAQQFKCSLKPDWLRLEKINGKDLNQMCDRNIFPATAYLATSREKNIVYQHQKDWNDTVRILSERHIKMYPVKKIGGNLFNNIDRGGLCIYHAATNEYHDIDCWLESGIMMICSGKI